MKLYYAPGACSLADHIALYEGNLRFEHEGVDLRSHRTASGADFMAINSKGYVPALVLDGGEIITENIAVLDWIAAQSPALGLEGLLGRTRLLEMLAYISTEVHKGFKPLFTAASEDEKAEAGAVVAKRLRWLAERMHASYLFGDQLSVADCYLFVMLLWTQKFGIEVVPPLPAFRDRMLARTAVQTALTVEGIVRDQSSRLASGES